MEKEKAGALVGTAAENPLLEEDEEGDDSDSEEEDYEGDWEEREIKAAFESYAEEPPRRHASVDTLSDEDKLDMGQIPYASLRPALIQLMNRNIPQEVIFSHRGAPFKSNHILDFNRTLTRPRPRPPLHSNPNIFL